MTCNTERNESINVDLGEEAPAIIYRAPNTTDFTYQNPQYLSNLPSRGLEISFTPNKESLPQPDKVVHIFVDPNSQRRTLEVANNSGYNTQYVTREDPNIDLDLLINRVKSQSRSGIESSYLSREDVDAHHIMVNRLQVSAIASKNAIENSNLEVIKEVTETKDYRNIPVVIQSYEVPRNIGYGYEQSNHRYTPQYRTKKEALSKPRYVESRPYIPKPNVSLPQVNLRR